MALTEEESKKIKESLLKQLSRFPEEKQGEIKEKVESMTSDQVENLVQENQLTHLEGQCIFCSIISGENSSFKVGENKDHIAILEINPLSRGHVLIIPKEHTTEPNESTQELSEEISEKLKERFNPNEIKFNKRKIMDHNIIEVIPFYGNEKERSQASEEELIAVQEELNRPTQEIEIEPKVPLEEDEIPELPKIKSRIP